MNIYYPKGSINDIHAHNMAFFMLDKLTRCMAHVYLLYGTLHL